MHKKIHRPNVREGYDHWAKTYDTTPNPLIALDQRDTLKILQPRQNEIILDAGCGTGRNLSFILGAGSLPIGLDFSIGMLGITQLAFPNVHLAQADLNNALPIMPNIFDAVLCALVGEHLTNLHLTFLEVFFALRPGGRFIFSVFHPEMAAAGIEANFAQENVEYRLGAERHTVDDYLTRIEDAGFRDVQFWEFAGDNKLADEVPKAAKYINQPLLLVVEAIRPAKDNY